MNKPIYILGISCFYHDSAAVLLKDGQIVFAAQEERFTRKKQDESIPINAINKAFEFEGISIKDIDAVGFYEKPLLKFFDRILQSYFRVWPFGYVSYLSAMKEWMNKKLWTSHLLKKELNYDGQLYYSTHHESHAASAFFASGYDDSTIVTVDGVGEWATATMGYGKNTDIDLSHEVRYPHSLGLLYSAVTYYLGFKVNSAEYKVMGLAPYGEPKYVDNLRELIDIKEDGSFELNMKYFTYDRTLRMTGKTFEKLLGQPRRKPESDLEQFHKDVARSVQEITEEIMLKVCAHAKKLHPSKNLCLAGGVALNCVANGKILRSGMFENVYIQPASGDAGGALGVAYLIWHREFKGKKTSPMPHPYYGLDYSDSKIEEALKENNLPYEKLSESEIITTTAKLMEGEGIVGWFQGRMEYGPRALGNRSIIADARNKDNWQKVNLKIKFRESFRPFAPTVLEERASEYFDLDRPSPYMLLVADVHPDKREEVPAITHVDGTARIQTVSAAENPKYHKLISEFAKNTGCPVIINTSFNVRGEPIVECPRDAINCFLHTQMDYLVLGNYLVRKSALTGEQKDNTEYLEKFELD